MRQGSHTQWDELPDILSTKDAANILRCDLAVVRRLARSKGFPAITIGRAIRISRDGLRRWISKEAV